MKAFFPGPGSGPCSGIFAASGVRAALAAGLLCLVAGCGVFFLQPEAALAAGSPVAALEQAQRGIDAADSSLFNEVVDVASVVNRASDALFLALKEQAERGEVLEGNLGMLLSLAASSNDAGAMDLLRPVLVSEVKNFVATGINGGYFAGKPNNTVSPSRASLASALKKMPEGRRRIVPGAILSEQGGKARMQASFVDPKAGPLPLELLLEERNGVWRVMEILNAKELFSEAARRNRK